MAHRKIRRNLARAFVWLTRDWSRPRGRVRTIGGGRIIAEGLEHGLWKDFYHNSMGRAGRRFSA